jgi:hypothetical protein
MASGNLLSGATGKALTELIRANFIIAGPGVEIASRTEQGTFLRRTNGGGNGGPDEPPPEQCTALQGPCALTFVHVDENRCEDDAFDIFVVSPRGSERFIRNIDLVSSPAGCCGSTSGGQPCPQTRIEVPVTINPSETGAGGCTVRIVLRKTKDNCCSTLTRFSVVGPAGEVYSQYFDSGGINAQLNIGDICNPAP